MLTQEQVPLVAFEWAIDYKPWDNNLQPQEYAERGFIEGYLLARKDILRDLGLTEVKVDV